MQIYILEGEEQRGPFSIEELQAKIHKGECTSHTLAWHSGETEWQRLETFLEPNTVAQVVPLPEMQGNQIDSVVATSGKTSTVIDILWRALSLLKRAKDTAQALLKWYRSQRLGVRRAILIIPLVFITGVFIVGKRVEPSPIKASDEERYAVFKGTPFYTRREVVLELEKAANAGGEEHSKLREKLEKSGDELRASSHLALSLINKNSESGYWEFTPLSGLSISADRIWVPSHFLMGEDDMNGFHIITGLYVFNGREAMDVGRTTIGTLGDLVMAVMAGKVSMQTAHHCIFMPEAQEGDQLNRVGDYLIYRGVRQYRTAYTSDFAIECRRDGSSDFRAKPLRIVGMKEFATEAGLVRQIPEVGVVEDPRGPSKTPRFERLEKVIPFESEGSL